MGVSYIAQKSGLMGKNLLQRIALRRINRDTTLINGRLCLLIAYLQKESSLNYNNCYKKTFKGPLYIGSVQTIIPQLFF